MTHQTHGVRASQSRLLAAQRVDPVTLRGLGGGLLGILGVRGSLGWWPLLAFAEGLAVRGSAPSVVHRTTEHRPNQMPRIAERHTLTTLSSPPCRLTLHTLPSPASPPCGLSLPCTLSIQLPCGLPLRCTLSIRRARVTRGSTCLHDATCCCVGGGRRGVALVCAVVAVCKHARRAV